VDEISQLRCDVAVVGGGPAGIAAAVVSAESGSKVVLIDDNVRAGGQVWRGGAEIEGQSEEAVRWFARLSKSGVQLLSGARVFHAQSGILDAETDRSLVRIEFRKLILATGAREMFLPFPGWTLPNVVGAGGLQALAKSGLPVTGKRVVVAGTGPLLLAVAAYLTSHGASVACVCEQAGPSALLRFGISMLAFPKKMVEAVGLRMMAHRAVYLAGTYVIAAIGEDHLEGVRVSEGGRVRDIPCDYLACGYHLAPNTELAQMLGCGLKGGLVQVEENQETTKAGIYCAGEPTGIGGVELSVLEGQIAGYAAADDVEAAERFFPARTRYRKFVGALKTAFKLRPELAALAADDVLLCRCEDVTVGNVRKHASWKAAKLHTRCGMGACQGRVCGTAAAFLFGWNIDSQRPPIFPARCSSLAAMSSSAQAHQTNGGPQ